MRSLALTILTMGFVLTAGHAQAQRYDPAYPVCLYDPRGVVLTIIAALYDGPMQGVGQRRDVQPQPVLRCYGRASATEQSCGSPSCSAGPSGAPSSSLST